MYFTLKGLLFYLSFIKLTLISIKQCYGFIQILNEYSFILILNEKPIHVQKKPVKVEPFLPLITSLASCIKILLLTKAVDFFFFFTKEAKQDETSC